MSMFWIEVSDMDTIEAFAKGDLSGIVDAIRRNTANEKIDLSFLEDRWEYVVEPDDDLLIEDVRKRAAFVGEQRGSAYPHIPPHRIYLSFRHPSKTIFEGNHPFLYLNARSHTFPQKVVETTYRVPKEVSISDRLGLRIVQPSRGFDSIAGNYRLKAYINKIIALTKAGYPSSLNALFFFGTAGSGKTYAAEAIAYELGYNFAYLDLPHFMSLPNPTRSLDEMFDFLQEQETRTLLLIDEIEKMFDFTGSNLKSQNVFGKLLTRLNDIYGDPSNKIIFIATANNIAPIVKNNPEFMRKGRFDDVFFLSYPTEKAVIELIDLFVGISNKEKIKETTKIDPEKIEHPKMKSLILQGREVWEERIRISIDPEVIYREVEGVYDNSLKVSDDEEFIYSPPEILTVIRELHKEAIVKMLESEDEHIGVNDILSHNEYELIAQTISRISPLQVYAAEGIKRQIAQAENYTKSLRGQEHEVYQKG